MDVNNSFTCPALCVWPLNFKSKKNKDKPLKVAEFFQEPDDVHEWQKLHFLYKNLFIWGWEHNGHYPSATPRALPEQKPKGESCSEPRPHFCMQTMHSSFELHPSPLLLTGRKSSINGWALYISYSNWLQVNLATYQLGGYKIFTIYNSSMKMTYEDKIHLSIQKQREGKLA